MSAALEKLRAYGGVLVAQLFFIAAGVYLGLRADQWREEREHRAAARATLENFRTELAENRARLRAVAAVHRRYADSIAAANGRGGPPPASVRDVFRRLGWQGLAPASFGHTAWDLSIATQSLTYLPRPLTFRLARVYDTQRLWAEQSREAGAALFSPAGLGASGVLPWLTTFIAFIEDATVTEPQLLRGYDRILPALDSAIARLPE